MEVEGFSLYPWVCTIFLREVSDREVMTMVYSELQTDVLNSCSELAKGDGEIKKGESFGVSILEHFYFLT